MMVFVNNKITCFVLPSGHRQVFLLHLIICQLATVPYVFHNFVIKVPANGTDEPKHVACFVTLQCCVCLCFVFVIQLE